MLAVPTEIQAKYDAALIRKSLPVPHHFYYKKWLRYYLDFCHKYRHPPSEPQSLVFFTDKLRQKNQKKSRSDRLHMRFPWELGIRNSGTEFGGHLT